MLQQWQTIPSTSTNDIWEDLHCAIAAEMGVGNDVETYDDALGALTAGGWCSDYYFTRRSGPGWSGMGAFLNAPVECVE